MVWGPLLIALLGTCWVTSMAHRSITLGGPQPLGAAEGQENLPRHFVFVFFLQENKWWVFL